jgi:hypothetical protein
MIAKSCSFFHNTQYQTYSIQGTTSTSSTTIIMPAKTPMTKGDSSRIQSSQVCPYPPSLSLIKLKLPLIYSSGQAMGGKDMSSSGFASRAQSAGDRSTNSSGYGQNISSGNNQQGSGNTGGNNGGQKK